MKRVTLLMLKRAGACEEQTALFARLFPVGVEPTRGLCLAHAAEFDWGWAARNLLPPSARKAYDEACAAAWMAYDEACAAAWMAYEEAVDPARKVHNKTRTVVLADAQKAYDEAVDSAWEARVEAYAIAFADAWAL